MIGVRDVRRMEDGEWRMERSAGRLYLDDDDAGNLEGETTGRHYMYGRRRDKNGQEKNQIDGRGEK